MALIASAILAGGRSTRLGRDKAHLPVAGTTLLNHLVHQARTLGPVAVVGRTAEPGIPADAWLPDAQANAGPLAGIAAALAWAAPQPLLVMAVDLPLLTTADLAWLADMPPGPEGTAVRVAGQVEPLFARWHTSLASAVAEALATGRRSPAAVLAAAAVAIYDAPPAMAERLTDCDTPAAWALAEARLRDPLCP